MTTKDKKAGIRKILNLAKSGRLVEAGTLCEQLCQNNKKNPELWLLLGEINQKLGSFDRAKTNYRRALSIKSDYAPAHTHLGLLQHSQGHFPAAAVSYQRSLKLNPQQETIQFNLGALLQEQGEYLAAMEKYQAAIRLKPNYAKAHANLGYLFRKQGKLEDAVAAYLKAARFAPDIAEIQYNLGITYLQQHKPDEAETCHRQALRLNAEYADAHAGLGSTYYYRGDYPSSLTCYRNAVGLNPQHLDALLGIANSLAAQSAYEEAAGIIQQSLQIDPDNIETRTAHGTILLSMGQPDAALSCCKQILQKIPGHLGASVLAANALEKKGDINGAYQYLKAILERQHVSPDAAMVFASISKALEKQDDAIYMMENILEKAPGLPATDRYRIEFTLGDTYDSKGDYDNAFEHYSKGNALKQAEFDPIQYSQEIDSLVMNFNKDFLAHTSKATLKSNRPVFVVGMPRSGTSLVEQILSSHSKVFGAGELPDIINLTSSLGNRLKSQTPYPNCVSQFPIEKMDHFAKQYLDHLSRLSGNAARVTDKMPANFMHLGLINILFPEARVIHCRRNPLDTCLSCYFQDFGPSHPYAYDLTNLGAYYQQYLRIMEHWQNSLTLPILDIQYEALTSNQETVTRNMLNFCELEWEDQCLDFHNNKRFIWTASYAQVRRPIYRKSVNRWKNYESHIDPLRKALKTNKALH